MSNKYSILSTNVRSLSKNHSELAQIARKYKPDVIVLSEIWNPHPGAAHLNGFHEIKMKTRLSTIGGGVGLYFSKKHKFEMLENLNNQHMKCLEVIGAKVTLGKYVVKIISIYRSPSSNQVDSIQDLDTVLQLLGNGNAIIAGDVNLNLAKQTNITLDYENLLTNHGFNQSVKFFTRLTGWISLIRTNALCPGQTRLLYRNKLLL